MRNPTLPPCKTILATLILAAGLRADPVLVTLEDHGLPDIDKISGGLFAKMDPYRIHAADPFRVDGKGLSGDGFSWLLEAFSSGGGFHEQFCEVKFFSSPGETLILLGPWISLWSEATQFFASADSHWDKWNGDLHVAGIKEIKESCAIDTPSVPEPASGVLLASGLLATLAAFKFRRSRA